MDGGDATTAICFDLDGTLVHLDQPYDDITEATFGDHLGSAPADVVAAYDEAFFDALESLESEPYHAGMRAALDHAETTGSLDSEAVADADVDAMVATLREREFAGLSVADAARDCLADLAADESVRLAVVSDGVGDWQRAKLAHHDLDEYFDEVLVSYDVGGHKVEGVPYEALRERIAVEEYVMVGDDYESDVEAARASGFVPVHYEDAETDLFAILRAML